MSDNNMNREDKVIGLLGGMGPEATIDVFQKIVKKTDAKTDEDHIRIVIDNNPKMPSRQDAILKGTESPGPVMASVAKKLEQAGADCIIICANTAHYFYNDVRDAVRIKVFHIIEETVQEIKRSNTKISKVGVLATNGAIKVKIFDSAFQKQQIEVLKLPDKLQNKVHDAIFSFKYGGLSNELITIMREAIQHLTYLGAEAIVLGCTEIPIILEGESFQIPLVDPNEVIARVAVNFAKFHLLTESDLSK
jgi:aspartate racemase